MSINKKSFTLIELLVVISILSILVTMLVGALETVNQRVGDLNCKGNLNQMYLLAYDYSMDHDGLLPKTGKDWPNPLNYWVIQMKDHGGMPLKSPGEPSIFICETAESLLTPSKWVSRNYGMNISAYNAHIIQLKSDSIIFADGHWRAGGAYYAEHLDPYGTSPDYVHADGFNAVMGDGHVETFEAVYRENFENITE